MEIIQEPIEFTKKILGSPQYDASVSYRFICYCVRLEVSAGTLLFNSLTKKLLLLSADEMLLIEQKEYKEQLDKVKELVADYFLVPVQNDDLKLADQLRAMIRLLERNIGINQYTILPTTACNARCFYCFEAGAPVFSMNEAVANDVAAYIIKNHTIGKKVYIRWFGGEPLCNVRAIDFICKELRKSDISFQSEIVSNGYLFTEELIEHAVNTWNLKNAQITLDGCKDTYNRVKNYVNQDENAFKRVTDNIELLCKAEVNVSVRLNMDKHNDHELLDLVDWLYKRYKQYNDLTVYSRPLFEDTEQNKVLRSVEERFDLTQRFIALQDRIKKYGFCRTSAVGQKIKTCCCQADSDNAVLISPEGKLGRCEHHINDDFFGTIYDNIPNQPWGDYCDPVEECKTCAAYPNCIRLKGCKSGRTECYDYERYIQLDAIRNGMKMVYEKYLSGKA